MKDKYGLSFIELLVAITIFLILSLAVFNAFSLGLAITRITQGQLKNSHKTNRFLDSLTRELRNSISFNVSEENPTGFSGRYNGISFFCTKDVFNETLKDLRRIVKVNYSYENDGLFKNVQYEDFSEIVSFNQQIDIPLNNFAFKYFNATASEDAPIEYFDEWSAENSDLPIGVRVELSIIDERDRKEEIISKDIFLPLRVFGRGHSGT